MAKIVDIVIPVFNGADVIEETIETIAHLASPAGWRLGVVVADDASIDATPDILAALAARHPWLTVTRSDENQGRSGACNAGVSASQADVVVFCDADCRYTRTDTIAAFVSEIERGADAVIGLIAVRGTGFWARYSNAVAQQRPSDASDLGLMAFTMANVAMRRAVFQALGGFSRAYSQYGFEDKDFLVRLEQSGANTIVRPDLTVSHDDDLSIAALCRKARAAGRYSGPVFRQEHPSHYRKLPYAKCDARTSSLKLPGSLVSPAASFTRRLARASLATPGIPFSLRRILVRAAVCAAYYEGSRRPP